MAGFKIFMLCMALLSPAVMIGFGYHWKTHPPKQINSGYGYRTRRSMHSKQAWNYAHEVCASVWRTAGWWTLAISLIAIALLLNILSDIETIGTLCFLLVLLQLIPLILALPITERALKQRFNI